MNNNIQPKNVLGLFPIPIGCYAYQGDIVSLRDKVREYIKTRPYNQNNDNPNLKHYLQKGDNTDGSVNINDIFFNHFDTDLEQFFNDSAFHFHTQVLGLDIQSDYNKYCTGIVGAFARLGDGGQSCEDAKFSLILLTLSWIIFGALGLILGIVGIIQIANDDLEIKRMIVVQNDPQRNADQQNIQVMHQIKMSQEQFEKYLENVKPPD